MIIYGMAEGSDATKHLPIAISPIDRTQFSKERLEHLINNIQPRIPGVVITPIQLSSGASDVAYVVLVPASTTAHQCTDKRYYRRHNFESVMMEDYEIRDVMNRNRFPALSIEVVLRLMYSKPEPLIGGMALMGSPKDALRENYRWIIKVKNSGGTVGNYLEGSVKIPGAFLRDQKTNSFEGIDFKVTNFLRTIYGSGIHSNSSEPEYKRILPSCELQVLSQRARASALHMHTQPFAIPWKLFCDDAPPREGVVLAADVVIEVNSAFEEEMARQSIDLAQLNLCKLTRI